MFEDTVTLELLFCYPDCLKIILKNYFILPDNHYIFCHLQYFCMIIICVQSQLRIVMEQNYIVVNGN